MPKTNVKPKGKVQHRLNGALVDIPTAAAYLGGTPWQIRRWAERGYLPSIRIGGRILFRRVALDSHLEKLERQNARGPEAA